MKKVLIIFSVLFLLFFILGIALIDTPAMYQYHLNACDKFIDRVCFSDRSVIIIFLERTAGNTLLLALFLISGIHMACGVLPPLLWIYRAYACGGTVAILFSVYGLSGVMIVFALFLPVHLLIDVIFLFAISLSFGRMRCFRFCHSDFIELLFDFLMLFLLIAIICFLEMLLLLSLFHPLGNIL